MLRFVLGESGQKKTGYIIDRIENELKTTDRNIILLVPEQQTVMSESRLSERLRGKYSVRLEVTNFTRLADSVARRVGGLSYSQLTPGAKKLILWRAVISVWDSLSYLNNTVSGNETRIIPLVYSAIREMTSSGVSPEDMMRASESAENDGLEAKARDLALIGTAYRSLLRDEFGEISEPLASLKEKLHESGILAGTSVYVDSFFSLTGGEKSVMNEIIRYASDVTVTLPLTDENESGLHLLAARGLFRELKIAAARYGGHETVTVPSDCGTRTKELELVSRYLWRYGEEISPSEKESVGNGVRIFTVRDRYEEAESAAAVIEKLIREGSRYSEIAVVAADTGKLGGITDAAMRKRGIPVFLSEPSKVISSPVIRLFVSLMKLPGKWGREDVLRALKTGLFPVDEKDICIFESYTETWNIRGGRMFSSPWSMNPDGYVEEISERGRSILEAANRVRDTVIPPTERLISVFSRGKANVRDICTAIVLFSEECGIPEALTRRADFTESRGERDDAAKERQIWRKFCSCLDTMADILGDTELSPSSFSSLLTTVAAEADAGAIPTGIDEVTLTSASSLRGDNIKHMILLGVTEGEFPSSPPRDGYFTKDDRETLSEAGIILGSSDGEKASEELYKFCNAIAAASESLTLFVPSVSFSEVCAPSRAVERIGDILGIAPVPFSSLPPSEKIFSLTGLESGMIYGKNAGERLTDAQIYRELTGKQTASGTYPDIESIPQEDAKSLFGKRIRLTQSKISKYVRCPFSYYAGNVLRLTSAVNAEIASVDIGSFLHSVMCSVMSAVKDRETPLTEDEVSELCDETVREYLAGIFRGEEPDGRLRYMFVRLRRHVGLFVDAMLKEVTQSRFRVYRTELPIGMASGDGTDKTPPPIIFKSDDGSEVSLYGIADRLDIYEKDGKTYVRVIDYKTGNHMYSAEKVRNGLDVQLMLYLFALWKCGDSPFGAEMADNNEILPAGAVFIDINPSDSRSDIPVGKEEARSMVTDGIVHSGVYLCDEDVLDAMDKGLSGKYVPFDKRRGDTLKLAGSDLKTLEQFGEMYSELEETVTGIVGRMKSGNAAIAPMKDGGKHPCKYCDYSSFCKNKAYVNES